MEFTLQKKMTAHVGECMAALLLVQPLLDVLSYFMQAAGTTALTTGLRMAMLAAVWLYAFAIAEKKRPYYVMGGVVAGFWLLHMANCFRLGYRDPVGDAAEYLKLVQFPLWTLAFTTFLEQRENLDYRAVACLAGNFAIILLVIALSYAVGMPAYTYDYPKRGIQLGVLGWFGVPNAQSAIVTILVPGVLLWAYRKGKLWLFSLCALLGFGLLYFTGTRLTYFGAFLIAGGFLVLVALGRKHWLFLLPLGLALAALVAFYGLSPMVQRQAMSVDSDSYYQELGERYLGEDKDFTYREGEEIPPEILGKIRKLYVEVYGEKGIYNATLLGDLIDRFGVDAVMEEYRYATDGELLYDVRDKKLHALHMVWQEKDLLTRLVGFEYAEATLGENNYDPENDFPALRYYYGYAGLLLYGGFCAYFPLLALWRLLRNFRRFWDFISVELGAYALMLCLGLGAAQFSGQVLRKPSVTVYLSLACALLLRYLGRWGKGKGENERKSQPAPHCAGAGNVV